MRDGDEEEEGMRIGGGGIIFEELEFLLLIREISVFSTGSIASNRRERFSAKEQLAKAGTGKGRGNLVAGETKQKSVKTTQSRRSEDLLNRLTLRGSLSAAMLDAS